MPLRALIVLACIAAVALAGYAPSAPTQTTYGSKFQFTYTGPRGDDVYDDIELSAVYLKKNIVRLYGLPKQVSSKQQMPYEVPKDVFPGNTNPEDTQKAADADYTVERKNGVVAVVDKNGGTIFSLGDLMYNTLNVSFTTSIPETAFVSGYGEHNYYYFLSGRGRNTLSLWNTDNGGIPWKKPLYGVHPVVFVADPSAPRFYAVAWINSNPQRLTLDSPSLTLEAAGGQLNLFVITGSTMMEVIQGYQSLLGAPLVPPYWSLGTHQCRWGYRNVSDLEAVVEGYAKALLPLETMWNDIDYMDQYRIFTTDPERYPVEKLAAFITKLHKSSRHYVQIVDPGVAAANNYSTFSTGLGNNSFVTVNNETLVNVVWPGWTAFPDFTSDSAQHWWNLEFNAYMNKIDVDGAWLDMNEVASFCGGYCPIKPGTPWPIDWNKDVHWDTFDQDICIDIGNCTITDSPTNNPPYNPLTNGWFIYNRTLDMGADLAMGKYYNTKAFYALKECQATHDTLKQRTKKRPFILTRASFAGSGRYTAHWTGDNYASFEPKSGGIGDSIQGVLASNLWGIPMVGADIGGFGGDTNEELLVRWYQLGTYYTFCRNHNNNMAIPQEPYRFSENAVDTIRETIFGRYRLLPYMFSQMVRTQYEFGPVLRHLSVEFPTELATYKESSQFMFGPSILVTPVIVKGVDRVTGYVPTGTWYHIWTGEVVTGGSDQTFHAPLYGSIPVLLRGGSVIPLHSDIFMTVQATRESGISLLCALSENGGASGSWFDDDGNDGELPATMDKVTSATYACNGNSQGGSVVSVVPKGASRLTQSRTANTNVTVYFPQAHGYTAEKLFFSLNGNAFTPTNLQLASTSLSFELSKDIDASVNFNVAWSTSPTGAAPAPAPQVSNNRGLIIIIVFLAIGLACSLLGILYFRKRVSEEQSLLGSAY